MTISIKATRAQASLDATSIVGPTTVIKGSSNTYTITDYDSFAVYSLVASAGTVSRSNETITLVIAAGEVANTMQLTITRDSSSVIKNIAIGAQVIGTPSITSPASGSTDVNIPVTLLATAFTPYPTGADTHVSSDWRVKDSGGTVIWQSLVDTVNKTSITIPTVSLSPATQYFAEVRYTGSTLGSSAYSSANQFTTSAVSIVRPSITSPINGATGVGETPTFTSSAFATIPVGSDTHASSNWRVKNLSTGATVWSSLNNTVYKTSITMPSGLLAVSTEYTVEIQYNGSTLPASQWSVITSFTTSSAFDYGNYLVTAANSTPFINFYGKDIDTLVRLTNPTSLPENATRAVAFSPDGDYLAMGGSGSGSSYLYLYKRSGDSIARLANPSVLPTGSVLGVSFSPDSIYLAVAHTTSPFLTIYKRDGDVFSKLANPASLPANNLNGCSFSADGNYLAVSRPTAASPTVYKRSGDTFTKLADPAAVAGGTINGVCFSADNLYLAVANNTNSAPPAVNIYKKSGDAFNLLPVLSDTVGGAGNSVAFSADSTYLAVAKQSSPYMAVYKRSGDTFTKLADPAVLPAGIGTGICFSADGLYLALSQSNTPYLSLYKRSGDVFNKLANPASPPTSSSLGLAIYPPVLGR